MSTKNEAVLAGITALFIAVSLIVIGILAGVPMIPSNSATSSTTQAATSSAGQQGSLSILLTDPPNVPSGVSKVYITYANLAVHISEAGNASGWTIVQQQGSIELMGTVNVSQTIAAVRIQSGDYNLIRFNITSAQATYNGKNYTAFVPSSELTVPIISGIEVNAWTPSATIVDITPTVMNIGSTSNPEFIIRPVAKAFPVPSNQVSEDMDHQGFRMNLNGYGWWHGIQQRYTANLSVISGALTANSLSVTVKNMGTNTVTLRLVTITPLASAIVGGEGFQGGMQGHNGGYMNHVPDTLFQSAIYVVLQNGTLVPVQHFYLQLYTSHSGNTKDNSAMAGMSLFGQSGFLLASGATTTLSYEGAINLGIAFVPRVLTSGSIVPGQQYLVTVLGDQSVASMVVTAS